MASSPPPRCHVSGSQFGDNATIYQADVGTVHYNSSHRPGRAGPRAMRYTRSVDIVQRPDIADRLNYGWGGSGRVAANMEIVNRLTPRRRWMEKEPVDKKALQFGSEVLGETHHDIIESMISLATTYHAQGRYTKAEVIYGKVLDHRREVLVEKHPDTISTMASLATTYYAQGRYDEDKELSAKVLDLRREILGEKHPDTWQGLG